MDQTGVIAYARELSSSGNYKKAFDLYLLSFEKDPEGKIRCENEFRAITGKLNRILADTNNVEEIFSNFGKAIDMFPNNVDLLNETGKYLMKYSLYQEACAQFQRALRVDPGFVNAEKNLNSSKNVLMQRWHFRMLNDKIRNDSYHAAILEVAVPNVEKVLDVGTGTGILAMYATERNPKKVVACDCSVVMAQIADANVKANKLSSVVVHHQMSTDMVTLNAADKYTLLVTEVFDAGLLGEHVMPALVHAWRHLLAPDAKVIPNKAEFFVMGVRSDLLNSKYQLQTTIKNILKIPHFNVHVFTYVDTYDCEDIHYYRDIKYLTEPKSIMAIEFGDQGDIQRKYNYSEPMPVALKAKATDTINAYIGWFNLYLTENITVTTNPLSDTRANAWQQAVFYDNIPKRVTKNETINLKFLMNLGKITLLSDQSKESIVRISKDMMKFLNDAEFMKLIKNCIGMACVYFGQMAEIPDLKIVDFCPFPLFGLLMMSRGVKSLICYANYDWDKEFIERVFTANNMDLSNVKIMMQSDFRQDSFLDKKFHVIFSNILHRNGELSLFAKDMFLHLKNNHLHPGGLVMPANVTLTGQIVNSHWLDINNIVHNKNVGKYKIKTYINNFQVSQNYCLDYAHLEYTALTEPVELGNCCNLSDEVFNVPIIRDGEANAIICWYKLEPMEGLGYITTKRPYSFVDGIAFLANPKVPMKKDETANILCCVDTDGSFKLLIDVENARN